MLLGLKACILQEICQSKNPIQWCSDFVAHGCEEGRFGTVGRFCFFLCLFMIGDIVENEDHAGKLAAEIYDVLGTNIENARTNSSVQRDICKTALQFLR